MLYSIWAWHVICSPDAFSWNFGFVFLNLAQVVYLVYEMRPVKFDPELEEVYHTLFEPFKVGKLFRCFTSTKMNVFFSSELIRLRNQSGHGKNLFNNLHYPSVSILHYSDRGQMRNRIRFKYGI